MGGAGPIRSARLTHSSIINCQHLFLLLFAFGCLCLILPVVAVLFGFSALFGKRTSLKRPLLQPSSCSQHIQSEMESPKRAQLQNAALCPTDKEKLRAQPSHWQPEMQIVPSAHVVTNSKWRCQTL